MDNNINKTEIKKKLIEIFMNICHCNDLSLIDYNINQISFIDMQKISILPKPINIKSCCKYINGIEHIFWINLDSENKRKTHMESILNKINISNTRISAININSDELLLLLKIIGNNCDDKIDLKEICCTLSHIKAISLIYDCYNLNEQKYFMICEDDIEILNPIILNIDLETIINNSPEFDVLKLTHITTKHINDIYAKHCFQIHGGSTVCYIISSNGVKNFVNNIAYIENNTNLVIRKKFSQADGFIYEHFNTIAYKYCFASYIDAISNIHPDHHDIQMFCKNTQLKYILNDLIN
jgi:GR25 family glycosyltransferase involved in LPS biosynthesis